MPHIAQQTPVDRRVRSRSKRKMKHLSAGKQRRTDEHLPLRHPVPIKRLFLMLVLLCGALVLSIWLNIQIDAAAESITNLEQKIYDQQSNNRYVQSELNALTTFDRIAPVVKSRFGMDFPDSPKIFLNVPDEIVMDKSAEQVK